MQHYQDSIAALVAGQASDVDDTLRQGIGHFDQQDWPSALACFEAVSRARPRDNHAHNYRARALERLGRLEEALVSLDAALATDPTNIFDLRNRAFVLRRLRRLPEAVASYEAALALHPDDTELLIRHALALNELERPQEALASINRALERRPDDLVALNTRAIVLENLERYPQALEDLDRMLAQQPDHVDAINNVGMVLARMGRLREALICYDRSLALQPEQIQAKFNRSLVRLCLGDWIRGFQEFEGRWQTQSMQRCRLQGLAPLWLGQEDVNGKTLLLYFEQGYGDTLQCARYIPLLAARGARIVVAVPTPLVRLLRSVPGVTHVLSGNESIPAHDYHCPFMSLLLAFKTTPDTIPVSSAYLRAEPEAVARWAAHLGPKTLPRIGLVWSGHRYAPLNRPRDISLHELRPLLCLNARFIGMQKEIADDDQALLPQLPTLESLGGGLRDFADTAGLIENLDLVISVDTAVVHLAGAMGKPVWLLNRYASCWRWLQEGEHSAWYLTLRQFRQPALGDWRSVVTRVQAAAAEFLDNPTRSSLVSNTSLRSDSTPPEKVRFVCATRLSRQEFFARAPLGRSLPMYRGFPKRQAIELRLFPENAGGLPTVYNTAIEEARASPAILIFIHDDVYLGDYYWAEHLHQALRRFDLVGLAGNRRRVPRQASWMYLDGEFTRDNFDNLSGVLGHGNPFPDLKELSVYGEPGQQVKLLDGVLLAIRSELLLKRDLRFDTRFRFHFYDMDFCRQAELRNIRMGTCAMSIVHASAGVLGSENWRTAYRDYLVKYDETN